MYIPKPVDTDKVVLPEEIVELTEKIAENVRTLLSEIERKKPSDAKVGYVQSVSVNSTMGPGVWVDYTEGE